ncbi:unnamed protein product [Lasius platythorax]|uniref:Uncharacterized protein n=1 Tax=Lasius platythorax TaxID=488582 RepID=A0AAV2NZT8_9HYME
MRTRRDDDGVVRLRWTGIDEIRDAEASSPANTERSYAGEHRFQMRTVYNEYRGRGERVSRMPRARDSEGDTRGDDSRCHAFLTQIDRSTAKRDRRVYASFYQPMRRTSTDRRGCLLNEFKTFPRH